MKNHKASAHLSTSVLPDIAVEYQLHNFQGDNSFATPCARHPMRWCTAVHPPTSATTFPHTPPSASGTKTGRGCQTCRHSFPSSVSFWKPDAIQKTATRRTFDSQLFRRFFLIESSFQRKFCCAQPREERPLSDKRLYCVITAQETNSRREEWESLTSEFEFWVELISWGKQWQKHVKKSLCNMTSPLFRGFFFQNRAIWSIAECLRTIYLFLSNLLLSLSWVDVDIELMNKEGKTCQGKIRPSLHLCFPWSEKIRQLWPTKPTQQLHSLNLRR